jgi:integrase
MTAPRDGRKRQKAEEPEWPKEVHQGNITVKIYRRTRANGTEGFEVADYTTGTRRLRSYPTFEKAEAGAQKIARLVASGDVEAASMRNSEAASYGRAVELLRPTGVCLEVAAAHFAEAFKILSADRIVAAAEFYRQHNADRIDPKTVTEVVDELLANKSKKEGNTVDDLRTRCLTFAESFKVPISTITTADVQKWLDGLKDIAERTRFNYRTKVNQLFRFAERRGYIAKHANPVEGTEKPDVPEGKIEIYTPTEIDRLLNAATPDFQVCIALGAFAGLRSSEIQRLDWNRIGFQRGHIEATGKKRGTPSRRFVPITANLRKWLEPHAKKSGLVWKPDVINRDRAEDYYSDVQLATSAGTEDKKMKIKPVAWKHNALRHSFISYRLAEVQNANQVALEAGNSAAMIFKHYRELVTKEDAVKWFAITPKEKGEDKIIQLAAATVN